MESDETTTFVSSHMILLTLLIQMETRTKLTLGELNSDQLVLILLTQIKSTPKTTKLIHQISVTVKTLEMEKALLEEMKAPLKNTLQTLIATVKIAPNLCNMLKNVKLIHTPTHLKLQSFGISTCTSGTMMSELLLCTQDHQLTSRFPTIAIQVTLFMRPMEMFGIKIQTIFTARLMPLTPVVLQLLGLRGFSTK